MSRKILLPFLLLCASLAHAQLAPADTQPQENAQPQPAETEIFNAQWLKQYDNRRSDELQRDPQFQALLADSFQNMPPAVFWHKRPVLAAFQDFFTYPGPIFVENHRFVLLSGTVSRSPNGNGGLLWIDTHTDPATPLPWLVFCALDTLHHKLYLFSSRDLAPGEVLPHQLRLNVGRWMGGWTRRAGYVQHVYLTSPGGETEMHPGDVSVALGHFTGR